MFAAPNRGPPRTREARGACVVLCAKLATRAGGDRDSKSKPGGEPFAYYRGVPNASVEVEAGFPVVGVFRPRVDVRPAQLPGGRVVTGVHIGTHENLGSTYPEMTAWATAHGLRPTGDMWEIYLTDPDREPDPQNWRTGLFLRVE